MKDEIKFNLNKNIIMQIEMASYMKYNSRIASINEHLGEIYGYSDLKDAEEAQLHYEKELAYKAIQKLQEENQRLKDTMAKIKDLNTMQYLRDDNFKYSLNEILQGDDVSENKSNE